EVDIALFPTRSQNPNQYNRWNRWTLTIVPPKPQQKDWQEKLKEVMGLDLGQCPCCKTGRMRLRRGLAPTARSPPRVQVQLLRNDHPEAPRRARYRHVQTHDLH
ncbi:MAG: hypothetical protein AAFP89_25225, partial [Bacteroidota bacterium]